NGCAGWGRMRQSLLRMMQAKKFIRKLFGQLKTITNDAKGRVHETQKAKTENARAAEAEGQPETAVFPCGRACAFYWHPDRSGDPGADHLLQSKHDLGRRGHAVQRGGNRHE